MKESYVKATGTGISVDLQSLDFTVMTAQVDIGTTVGDTVLKVDNKQMEDWKFEQTRLDEDHWVAVALKLNESNPVQVSILQK